jgi:hypothetical protein
VHVEARNLCAEFGYPYELEKVLTSLREILEKTYGSSLKSVILCGSIATGDFVWLHDEKSVRLMSDIDAIAVVDGNGDRGKVEEAICNLRFDKASTPLFHVDVTICPISALKRVPRSFQAVEIRKAGRLLAGEDMRPRFPAEFDPATARQAFFSNLWKPLLFSSIKWTRPNLYAQSIARQILDVAILACSENGNCIPGHRRRAQAFLALPEDHGLATRSVRVAVRHALLVRQGQAVDVDELEREQYDTVRTAVTFLESRSWIEGTAPCSPQRIQRLLPHRSLRRIAVELWNECRGRRCDPMWLCRRKEALAAAALLQIYEYRAQGCRGIAAPAARHWLAQFSGESVVEAEGEEFLKSVRQAYWAGILRLHPFSAKDRDWVEPLIGGQYV